MFSNGFLGSVHRQLSGKRLLQPMILATPQLWSMGEALNSLFPKASLKPPGQTNLMGRDVLLLHSGEKGWAELLEDVCQQSPGRLFVIAPECPKTESLKLEWIADMVMVGHETYTYEVHELGLSA
jgi:hypothetical protein